MWSHPAALAAAAASASGGASQQQRPLPPAGPPLFVGGAPAASPPGGGVDAAGGSAAAGPAAVSPSSAPEPPATFALQQPAIVAAAAAAAVAGAAGAAAGAPWGPAGVPVPAADAAAAAAAAPPKSRQRAKVGVAKPPSCAYKGVALHKRTQRWDAAIWQPSPTGGRGRQVFLGSYHDAADAARAYDRAALCFFKREAMTNFPLDDYRAELPRLMATDEPHATAVLLHQLQPQAPPSPLLVPGLPLLGLGPSPPPGAAEPADSASSGRAGSTGALPPRDDHQGGAPPSIAAAAAAAAAAVAAGQGEVLQGWPQLPAPLLGAGCTAYMSSSPLPPPQAVAPPAGGGGGGGPLGAGAPAGAGAALRALALPHVEPPRPGDAAALTHATLAAFRGVEAAAAAVGLPARQRFAVCAAVEGATSAEPAAQRFLGLTYWRLRLACAQGDAELVRAWMAEVGGC
ncbi:MAG: hypothetical protein J3K34DRAFT_520128 [Monoraphidium minutum]|nr:MAG: hypothetical protein J3K34DRAFT_520128 [Monoraphidium minutum]